MKEELTTKMHAEFFGDEFSDKEWAAMGVFGAVNKGVPLEEALANYELTEAEYKALCKELSL